MNKTSSVVSETIADWSREAIRNPWDPGRKMLRAIRDYQRILGQQGEQYIVHSIHSKVAVLRHKFWSLVTQCEVDLTCSIGGGGFSCPTPME